MFALLPFVCHSHGCENATYLHSIMTEEKPCISAHAHLEACGAAPHGRLPDQQCKGTALITAIAKAKDV